MRRVLYGAEHDALRESVRRFLEVEVLPNEAAWEAAGIVPRQLYTAAGKAGLLGMAVPAAYGGAGIEDFRYNTVISEEFMRAGAVGAGMGLFLHNDVVLPYLLSYCDPEQQRRWLPGIASGELVTAIAMTEPETGSDLAGMKTRAVRDGDHYVVNGAKTFITNGVNADLVLTAVKTDPSRRHEGVSLLMVERGTPGFERGRNLDKLGQHAQDTAELFFTDARVPAANLLGDAEGRGFGQLVRNLPQERVSLAVGAVAAARGALTQTLEHVREHVAAGALQASQRSRFLLAELDTETDVAQAYVDRCVAELNAGALTAEDAAKAKWWCTELQGRVVDACLQLHGGDGCRGGHPIGRAWLDARVSRIYGGTTEIMKEVVGRGLGL